MKQIALHAAKVLGSALAIWVGIWVAVWLIAHPRTYEDHLTGCQYLTTGLFGSITPRLDWDGEQVCVGPNGNWARYGDDGDDGDDGAAGVKTSTGF